jgi:YjbE family integral membrane protein
LLQIFSPAALWSFVAQFQTEMQQPAFWLAVGKIIWINVLLSGDNALVIALACRGLSARHRLWGMILGAGIAVLLRIIFTGIVATLMELPYLKLAGGLALIVIAAKLLVPEDEDEDSVASASHLWHAIQIVVVADIVMSLDNVIAVAAAANGSVPLLVLGLAISVPMIVAGAALIMLVLSRLPILVWAGAALLGWIAGVVIATDPAVHPLVQKLLDGSIDLNLAATSTVFGLTPHFTIHEDIGEFASSLLGAIVVLIAGTLWRRSKQQHDEELVPIASTPTDRDRPAA